MNILAFDIGGSSIKYGIVNIIDKKPTLSYLGSPIKLKSNQFSELEQILIRLVDDMTKKYTDIKIVGISTTGSVDKKLTVLNAGHFEGYRNISWGNILKDMFPQLEFVYTANDGKASTWGEYKSNEFESLSHIHFVVGTGIGGGVVINDELLIGECGQAGYLGHIKVTDQETTICSCKKKGCVETLASLRGIEYLMFRATNQKLDFKSIHSLALNKDKYAIESFTQAGYWLGIGIGNSMNVIDPSVVSIGGGIIEAANELYQILKEDIFYNSIIRGVEYASNARIYSNCKVRKSEHGNSSGLIGAALLSLKYRNN